MKLSESGINRLIEHIHSFLKLDCPMCKDCKWSVMDEVMQLVPYYTRGTGFGGDRIPVVFICCSECGYTVLFNAIAAGLVESFPPTLATIS